MSGGINIEDDAAKALATGLVQFWYANFSTNPDQLIGLYMPKMDFEPKTLDTMRLFTGTGFFVNVMVTGTFQIDGGNPVNYLHNMVLRPIEGGNVVICNDNIRMIY